MDCSSVGYLWIIVMFLSGVWTLILMAHIHYRGFTSEQVMLNSPNLFQRRNNVIYILYDLRISIIGWTIPLMFFLIAIQACNKDFNGL